MQEKILYRLIGTKQEYEFLGPIGFTHVALKENKLAVLAVEVFYVDNKQFRGDYEAIVEDELECA